jgi:NAD(P)-dependent dehydrogenase (short-subunit alcohol dehydrogenase family)
MPRLPIVRYTNSYAAIDVSAAWKAIHTKYPLPKYSVRVAVFNAAQGVFKPFLDVTPEDVRASAEVNVEGAFAFSREAILAFKENKIEDEKLGKRGSLIFTSATAALRGNITTSTIAAGKFAV